jgi:hypothetical protein
MRMRGFRRFPNVDIDRPRIHHNLHHAPPPCSSDPYSSPSFKGEAEGSSTSASCHYLQAAAAGAHNQTPNLLFLSIFWAPFGSLCSMCCTTFTCARRTKSKQTVGCNN